MTKEPKGTLLSKGKVPVIERIAELARKYPSRSAAARAWGINVNTLNSYYKNETPPPVPRENLLARIAEREGVSLDWLKTGKDEIPKLPENSVIRDGLSDLLSFLTDEERYQLTMVLTRKGVETILYLLNEDNLLLLQQPDTLKAHMLQEYVTGKLRDESAISNDQDKVCARSGEKQTPPQSLASGQKKAG
ncbi:helix-turn-helix domain-containing protein [Limnobaculum xujianqingii]|uniref:bacteriophage CI repressor n=1 Tax=Limnobaculum xujianqingii TaxID=2738837 RepID=UPI00112E92AC|nr:bacteriophage CI repressor [Limnobaculum xujianqingii]